jgi:hypothetical protein
VSTNSFLNMAHWNHDHFSDLSLAGFPGVNRKCKGRPRKTLVEHVLNCAPLRATSSALEDSTPFLHSHDKFPD